MYILYTVQRARKKHGLLGRRARCQDGHTGPVANNLLLYLTLRMRAGGVSKGPPSLLVFAGTGLGWLEREPPTRHTRRLSNHPACSHCRALVSLAPPTAVQ